LSKSKTTLKSNDIVQKEVRQNIVKINKQKYQDKINKFSNYNEFIILIQNPTTSFKSTLEFS